MTENNKFSPEVIENLKAKLDLNNVSERDGPSNKKLSFLEQWFVIDEANRIFGHDGWSRETIRLEVIGSKSFIDTYKKEKWSTSYRSTVRITVNGVIREGSGYGDGMDNSELKSHELALKEAESDAMKRAFMTFGYPFGLALYDKAREHVEDSSKPQPQAAANPEPKQEVTPEERERLRVRTACFNWFEKLKAAKLSANDLVKKFSEFKEATNTKGENMWKLANTAYPDIGKELFEKIDQLTKEVK